MDIVAVECCCCRWCIHIPLGPLPVPATMSAPLLAVHSIMSPRRAEMAAALALAACLRLPPHFPSFFYSVSYTLVRYFYRSCGGPLALLPAQQQSGRLFVYLFVLQYVFFPLPSPGATIQPSFHPYSFNDVIIFSHLFLGCFLPNFLAALLLLLVVVVFLLFIRQTSSEQQHQQLNWPAVRLLSRIPPWNMLVCINSS